MGIEPDIPIVVARPPAVDFPLYDEHQQVITRTQHANVAGVVPGTATRPPWYRQPAVDGHVAWVSPAEAQPADPAQPWDVPVCRTFALGRFVLADFGVHQGWRVEAHPRFVADLTGDRRGDVVGFGDAGVHRALADGTGGFGPAAFVLENFGVQQGWRVEAHPRFVADLTGDRRGDLLGCGDAGVWVALNDGSGGFHPAALVLENFGVQQGWRVDRHPRFVADLTGDRRGDVVGFGDAGVWVALNDGGGGLHPATFVLANLGVQQGWRVDRHPRFVVDLTGDGRADLVGCGDAGVWVALNDGSGGFGEAHLVLEDFSPAQGWHVDQHPRFVADTTGDGHPDVVGFGDAGVYVAPGDGAGGFGPATLVVPFFGADTGVAQWSVGKTPRLLADVTGGHRSDVVGFGTDLVFVAARDPDGAVLPQVVSELGTTGARPFVAATGWTVARHPRLAADVTGDGRADLVGFGDDGVWTARNLGLGPVPEPDLVNG